MAAWPLPVSMAVCESGSLGGKQGTGNMTAKPRLPRTVASCEIVIFFFSPSNLRVMNVEVSLCESTLQYYKKSQLEKVFFEASSFSFFSEALGTLLHPIPENRQSRNQDAFCAGAVCLCCPGGGYS
jgi:hypothetical protein